jgi:hypothetical protein
MRTSRRYTLTPLLCRYSLIDRIDNSNLLRKSQRKNVKRQMRIISIEDLLRIQLSVKQEATKAAVGKCNEFLLVALKLMANAMKLVSHLAIV